MPCSIECWGWRRAAANRSVAGSPARRCKKPFLGMRSKSFSVTIRLAVVLALLGAPAARLAAQQQVDVLIRGGTLIDGTGAARRRTDVGIKGERIAFVGDAAASRVTATKTIDATNLIVAPGFIDPHTHTQGDLSSPQRKANLAYLMQGVTTVITNNDGGGGIDIAKLFDTWTKQGIGTNAAVYIGQG